MDVVIKNKSLIIGSLSIILLISFSIMMNKVNTVPLYKKDLDGEVIATAPYPPSLKHPLGTDNSGRDILQESIFFEKITLLNTLIISISGFCITGLVVLFMLLIKKSLTDIILSFLEGFSYIPLLFMGIILLIPLQHVSNLTFFQKNTFELIVITVLSIPNLTILMYKEIQLILSKEFIISSKVIGANKLFILKKHVPPFIIPKLFIFFFQQIVLVLTLFLHLGIFNVISVKVGGIAGLIAQSFRDLFIAPWTVYGPVLLLSITIVCLKLILNGIERIVNRTTS